MGIIKIKDAVHQFGWKQGLSFWWNWNIVDPSKIFWWLNISHKDYCTYSGWYCKEQICSHKHLNTKKDIKDLWVKIKEEMAIVEEGKGGKCVYCNIELGTELIPDPNGRFGQWKVCENCSIIIKLQNDCAMGHMLGNVDIIAKAEDELYKMSQKTGVPITMSTIDSEKNVSTVEFTGEKDK